MFVPSRLCGRRFIPILYIRAKGGDGGFAAMGKSLFGGSGGMRCKALAPSVLQKAVFWRVKDRLSGGKR